MTTTTAAESARRIDFDAEHIDRDELLAAAEILHRTAAISEHGELAHAWHVADHDHAARPKSCAFCKIEADCTA